MFWNLKSLPCVLLVRPLCNYQAYELVPALLFQLAFLEQVVSQPFLEQVVSQSYVQIQSRMVHVRQILLYLAYQTVNVAENTSLVVTVTLRN